jgi:hypothetical protein
MLTATSLVGQLKSRAMANWCQVRGFTAKLVERRFAANFTIDADEPNVAVCGVDNALARAVLEQVGFKRIVEAGLGAGLQDYLTLRLHSLPGDRPASSIWRDSAPVVAARSRDQPAYRALQDKGMEDCGLTHLANRSVGAPFVGAVAASLVVAELLRLSLGAHRYAVIDASLKSLDLRTAVIAPGTEPFNPGVVRAAAE